MGRCDDGNEKNSETDDDSLFIEEQRKTKILSAAATIARAANVLEGMFKNS